MIKKSLTLLTLTAVAVEGKHAFNFWEHARSLKNTECNKDSECKGVSTNVLCLKQKISTKTENVCVP